MRASTATSPSCTSPRIGLRMAGACCSTDPRQALLGCASRWPLLALLVGSFFHAAVPAPLAVASTNPLPAVRIVPTNYPTIQEAIDASMDADTVRVQPGTYLEALDFLGKAIVVTGTDPLDRGIVETTVVQAPRASSCVTFQAGEDSTSVLQGVTLTGAEESGVRCWNASPTIRRCRIVGNRADEGGGARCGGGRPTFRGCEISGNSALSSGGGIDCSGASPRIEHCTIVRNRAFSGGAVYASGGSDPLLIHCTLYRNTARVGGGAFHVVHSDSRIRARESILWHDAPTEATANRATHGTIEIEYSDVEGGWPGPGNLDADPRFCMTGCPTDDLGLAADSPCLGAGREGGTLGALPLTCDQPLEHTPVTRRVPRDIPDIQSALDLSCDGDTVLVDPGTWVGTFDFRGQSTTLVGRGAHSGDRELIEATVLTSDRAGQVILARSGEGPETTLSGLTVERGMTRLWEPGGGILVENANLTIENCILRNNTTSSAGGGINVRGSTLRIKGSELAQNSVNGHWFSWNHAGGALYAYDSSVVIQRSSFRDNFAGPYDGLGGAIYFDGACEFGQLGWDPEYPIGKTKHWRAPTEGEESRGTLILDEVKFEHNTCYSYRVDDWYVSSWAAGGALLALDARVIARDSRFSANTSSGPAGQNGHARGGGLYLGLCESSISGGEFDGNKAEGGTHAYGGGIYAEGGWIDLRESVVRDNQTFWTEDFEAADGGGIYLGSTTARIEDCVVEGNEVGQGSGALSQGGGIHIHEGNALIQRSDICGNTANRGAGLAIHDGRMTLANTRLSLNQGSQSAGIGGGVFALRSDLELLNGIVTGNESSLGAAIVVANGNRTILSQCTVTENRNLRGTGATLYLDADWCEVRGSILWGNLPAIIHGPSLQVSFSDVEGGWPGEGNIDADPIFRSRASFAQLLAPNSPCIDTGDPTVRDGISDWHPRWPKWYPNAPRSDIGAYGGSGNWRWFP